LFLESYPDVFDTRAEMSGLSGFSPDIASRGKAKGDRRDKFRARKKLIAANGDRYAETDGEPSWNYIADSAFDPALFISSIIISREWRSIEMIRRLHGVP
jgi:hypothetical protein